MLTLFVVIVAITAFVVSPRAAALCLLVPLMGLCFGGFCWGLAAMVWPSLVNLEAFAGFVAMASVVAGGLSLSP